MRAEILLDHILGFAKEALIFLFYYGLWWLIAIRAAILLSSGSHGVNKASRTFKSVTWLARALSHSIVHYVALAFAVYIVFVVGALFGIYMDAVDQKVGLTATIAIVGLLFLISPFGGMDTHTEDLFDAISRQGYIKWIKHFSETCPKCFKVFFLIFLLILLLAPTFYALGEEKIKVDIPLTTEMYQRIHEVSVSGEQDIEEFIQTAADEKLKSILSR